MPARKSSGRPASVSPNGVHPRRAAARLLDVLDRPAEPQDPPVRPFQRLRRGQARVVTHFAHRLPPRTDVRTIAEGADKTGSPASGEGKDGRMIRMWSFTTRCAPRP